MLKSLYQVKLVVEHYFLKRWTKQCEVLPNVDFRHVVGDVNLSPTQCSNKQICPYRQPLKHIEVKKHSCFLAKLFMKIAQADIVVFVANRLEKQQQWRFGIVLVSSLRRATCTAFKDLSAVCANLPGYNRLVPAVTEILQWQQVVNLGIESRRKNF